MKTIISLLTLTLLFFACKKHTDEVLNGDPYADNKTLLKKTYADLAFAVYDDSYITAKEMQVAVEAFVAAPTSAKFDTVKACWLRAREPYGQSEVFRFAGGPIDNVEQTINAWPLDEVYIDYTIDSITGGMINNTINYATIDESLLISANKQGGDHNISEGFHAIEFLLWGQDLNYPDPLSPGVRPFTDFVNNGSATHQDRRRAYLKSAASLLVKALKDVRDAWDPTIPSNYRATFLALDNDEALRNMFTSLIKLSGDELAGKRLNIPYVSSDQEDEQSSFSDNTHRDIIANAKAIQNLYAGTYTRTNGAVISGHSIQELANSVCASRNTALMTRFQTTTDAVTAIPVPFDQAIIDATKRTKVHDAIISLQAEQQLFLDIAADFGITF